MVRLEQNPWAEEREKLLHDSGSPPPQNVSSDVASLHKGPLLKAHMSSLPLLVS